MKDSIDKNLEFKLTLFAGLVGAWWWILRLASKFDLTKEDAFYSLSFVALSFLVFLPLAYLFLMLVLTFFSAANKSSAVKKRIKTEYEKVSKLFFNQLAWMFLILPIGIFLAVFFKTKTLFSVIVSVLYLVLFIFLFFKVFPPKEWKKENVFSAFKSGLFFSGSMFVYIFIFSFVYSFAKVFDKYFG